MEDNIATTKLKIQEGEWIITLPVEKTNTIQDLKNLVEQLRNPKASLYIKPGWKIDHI